LSTSAVAKTASWIVVELFIFLLALESHMGELKIRMAGLVNMMAEAVLR
jgi:hypothetical protein